jgi:hypothetical protein
MGDILSLVSLTCQEKKTTKIVMRKKEHLLARADGFRPRVIAKQPEGTAERRDDRRGGGRMSTKIKDIGDCLQKKERDGDEPPSLSIP